MQLSYLKSKPYDPTITNLFNLKGSMDTLTVKYIHVISYTKMNGVYHVKNDEVYNMLHQNCAVEVYMGKYTSRSND